MQFKSILRAGAFGALFASMPFAAHANSGQQQAANTNNGASDASFRISTGVSFSTGDYGEQENTDVFAVPVSLTYTDGPLKVRVSVPWVQVDGPGSLLSTPEGRDGGGGQGRGRGRGGDSDRSGSGSSGSGGSGSSGSEVEVEDEDDDDIIDDDGGAAVATANKRSGFGDVNVAATYSFELGSSTFFEPTVKVKIPTASKAKRLGTGEVDVTISADLVQELGDVTVYAHGRRKFAGKPTGSTVRSTWGAGGGASFRVANGFSVGADYDWQQSAFTGRQASSEVTAWINARLAKGTSLTIYGTTGLNANSADVAGGATISFRF